jgi:uncharacterized protein (DUF1778 family)
MKTGLTVNSRQAVQNSSIPPAFATLIRLPPCRREVTPAKAGVQSLCNTLDSRLRGNDEVETSEKILLLPGTRQQPAQNISLCCTAYCRIRNAEDKAMSTPNTQARLEARISKDLHAMLKHAAALQGRTMTDFVVAAVYEAAQRAIEQAEVIRLSRADQQCFAQTLLSPPPKAPALERAFERRGRLLDVE